MNWISEATSLIQWRSDGGRRIMADACERCWNAANPDGERIQGITLTDAEREAIEGAMWDYGQYADEMALSVAEVKEKQAALRSLLKRLS